MPVIEHLQHGAGRRLQVMARALTNIFRLFPPDIQHPMKKDDLEDVQINLHAYFINLYGVFENFAWAFVHRHGLDAQLDIRDVGLFHRKTRKFLPQKLAEYVVSAPTARWRDEYLKTYRDALAHQVPLYVPPSVFTPEEGELFQRLFNDEMALLQAHEFAKADEMSARRLALGKPSFVFVPAFSNMNQQRPVYLHPQLISDSMTVMECGQVFFDHWHQHA
ncbi:hypothetical protein [Cupriavidus sp. D39]|uniref:hypothetical protein n=1 Tax=Cupriavidus sp. D39 TaxID=2997877 RepID=UPI00226EA804|nr:hypothetical protein [Cupriavidus sp. D39]MCY0856452.1 hypothetical protein [Cupriavidus sp. D39]